MTDSSRTNQLTRSGKVLTLAIAAGFTLIAGEAIAQGQGQGPQGGPAVTVVNTPENPVPVTGSLTGSVTVTNSPEVKVINEVTVRSADSAGRHAVTIQFSTNSTSGSGFQFWSKNIIYTVPDGKRLVIEDFDAQAFITPAANTGGFRGELFISGSGTHPFGNTTSPVVCTLTQTCFALSRLSRVYADAGSTVSVSFSGNLAASGGIHFVNGTINGYLVDLP